MQLPFVVFFSLVISCKSLQSLDRFNAFVKTLHGGWQTSWIEIPIYHLPRFRTPDFFSFKPSLPRHTDNDKEMQFNPDEDVKISLTFVDSKLVIPWITVYDAKEVKHLEKLTITFEHDEFDVLRVGHTAEYSRENEEGPSVVPFEVLYRWKAVQEEDLALGVGVMFALTLLLIIAISCFVASTYEGDAIRHMSKTGKKEKVSQN